MQKKINTMLCTLMDLRDAFEEIYGDSDNRHSTVALRMIGAIRYWEDEYGTDALQEAADRYQERLDELHGSM